MCVARDDVSTTKRIREEAIQKEEQKQNELYCELGKEYFNNAEKGGTTKSGGNLKLGKEFGGMSESVQRGSVENERMRQLCAAIRESQKELERLKAEPEPEPPKPPIPEPPKTEPPKPVNRCPVCNAQLVDGALFCVSCGASLGRQIPIILPAHRVCPNCGHTETEDDARFCTECGCAF